MNRVEYLNYRRAKDLIERITCSVNTRNTKQIFTFTYIEVISNLYGERGQFHFTSYVFQEEARREVRVRKRKYVCP